MVTFYNNPESSKMAVVVASVGFQGSGKSVCLRALGFLIEESVWLNPDEFGTTPAQFINEIKNSRARVTLVDRCNHNVKTRGMIIKATGERSSDCGARLIWIVFLHPDDEIDRCEKTVQECRSRLAKRQGHKTLNQSNYSLALNTVKKYYEPITIKEKGTVIILDMTETVENNVQFILNFLHYPVSEDDVKKAVERSMRFDEGCEDCFRERKKKWLEEH